MQQVVQPWIGRRRQVPRGIVLRARKNVAPGDETERPGAGLRRFQALPDTSRPTGEGVVQSRAFAPAPGLIVLDAKLARDQQQLYRSEPASIEQ